MGRYLHRKAISGTVPDNITWKASKYMGERVTPHKNNPLLNTDLHPDLLPLLNLPKLKKQTSHLIKHGINPKNPAATHQINQNIANVNQLDNWLKYHFPTGCNWADAPA